MFIKRISDEIESEITALEKILSRPCSNKVWDETSYQLRVLKELKKSLDKHGK